MVKGQSVFLVGPMGAGKTTIGRLLAEHLQYQFLDSDREIEARSGASIPWIFDVEGEAGFRKRETAMLDELTQRTSIILATGGGAVINPDNRHYLRDRGIVVYLKADLDELLRRTSHDKNRPLLQTDDPRARLQVLIEEREPWYMEIADIIFDTRHGSTKNAARELARKIRQFEKAATS
jgi:shikimate kinase